MVLQLAHSLYNIGICLWRNTMAKASNFEKSMAELEEIVLQLEQGELTLDDSLKQFEKGITLARLCQDVLTKASKKIEQLTNAHLKDGESSDEC